MYKAADKWLLPWFQSVLRRPRNTPHPVHILFAVCDHYEPLSPYGRQPHRVGVKRTNRWRSEYPRVVSSFRDADGRPPQHTFFFPEEEFAPDFMEPLCELCAAGFGEVEIHLHHDRDTAAGMREKILRFRDLLHERYGLLGCDAAGRPRYGFIHGNWALCNPFPDGRHCGVDREASLLVDCGCYADFTFPSTPSPTQPRVVNSIYCIHDDLKCRRRPYDYGRELRVGDPLPAGCGLRPRSEAAGAVRLPGSVQEADGPPELLLIQGPLALNWRWRKWGVLPRIEHADLCSSNPPSELRLALWIRQWIHVRGRPDRIFIKLHCHGCREENADVLLGPPMQHLHRVLTTQYNDGVHFVLHYVTAREMANIVLGTQQGVVGAVQQMRDLFIGAPLVRKTAPLETSNRNPHGWCAPE